MRYTGLPPGYVGPRTLSGAPAPTDPWPSQTGGQPSSRGANLGGFGGGPRAPAGQRKTGVATLGSLSGGPSGGYKAGTGIGSNVHGFGPSSSGGGGGAGGSGSGAGAGAGAGAGSRPGQGTYRQGNIGRLQHNDGPDSEDEGALPNLYTGGERSGLSVQDPEAQRRLRALQAMAQAGQGEAGRGQGMDMVNNIIRQAAEAGQAPPPLGGSSAEASSGGHFWGHGRSINAPEPDDVPRREVGGEGGPGDAKEDEEEDEEEEEEIVVRHLIFWADGFTVEDSELYRYDVPENQRLLHMIESQRAPNSVFRVRPEQQVDLHIERRIDQPYTPPPPGPTRPFAGQGNRLGNPVTVTPSSTARASGAAPAAPASAVSAVAAGSATSTGSGSSSSSSSSAARGRPPFELDPSQPVTTLQLRLSDGTRLVQKFNHTHTVGDVRRFLAASSPTAEPFALTTSFPPQPLTDDAQTLKAAGLLNAVVIQKRT